MKVGLNGFHDTVSIIKLQNIGGQEFGVQVLQEFTAQSHILKNYKVHI